MSKKDKLQEEEMDLNKDTPVDEVKDEEGVTVEQKEEKLSPEEEAKAKYNEINDKYLRLYSEFDNFRKRTQKEKVDLYKTAGQEVITALLPIIDDFYRAEKATQDSNDVDSIKEGMALIQNKFVNTLKQKGLEEIESAVGKDFDLELHEAITQIPAPTEKDKGKVIDEIEKGYTLNGKVIRYTKVVVGN